MVKRVVSIEAGVWWTKVALADYRKKNPPVHKAFAFRTPEHAVEDGYIRDKEAFASALKAELSRHDIRVHAHINQEKRRNRTADFIKCRLHTFHRTYRIFFRQQSCYQPDHFITVFQ